MGSRVIWTQRWDVFEHDLAVLRGSGAASGTWICDGLDLYHDADAPGLAWAQDRSAGGAPRLRLTSYGFDGTFLSLACAINAEGAGALRPGMAIRLGFHAQASRPVALHARLNILVEEAHEHLHAQRVLTDGAQQVIFQMDALNVDLERGARAWIDLIVNRPAMLELSLSAMHLVLGPAEAMHAVDLEGQTNG
ncbi:MAG: DUF6478 family protein [Pseudomonadota bacterium]